MASGRRELLASYGAPGRAASGLLIAGAAAFLLATVLAAPALVYLSVAAKAVAESFAEVGETVETPGGAVPASTAAAHLAEYSVSAGVAGLLVALSGVAVITAAWACRYAETCGSSIVRAAAGAWGVIALLMFASMSAAGPLLEAPSYVIALGVAGSLAAIAAAAAGGRAQKAAAAAGVAAAILLAVAVFQGGFPFKAGSVDVTWAAELAQEMQMGSAALPARALAAFTQPSYTAWEAAPGIEDTAAKIQSLLEEYKASPSDTIERSLATELSDAANILRKLSREFPDPLAGTAARLAERAQQLAGEKPPNTQAIQEFINELRALAEAAANHPPARLNAAAHLESLALIYPGIMIAAALGSAGGLAGGRKALILVAVAVLLAGVFLAYAGIRVYAATDHVNAYIGGLATDLDVRMSNVLWRSIATAAGIVRVTCVVAAAAGALITAGGALAAYIAAREA